MKARVSLVLVLSLVLSLAAGIPAPAFAEEATVLQVFSMPSNKSGLMDNSYWAEILKRDVGVQLELLPAGDQPVQKLQTLMASKSLPDIVIFKDDYTQITNAIEAGRIINLDEHQDALPNVYANIPTAIQYMRDNVDNGTGACYALPNSVTTQSSTTGITGSGPYLRWDLYEQLGRPELNDIEDYLPLLKQMLELEPQNPDGQPSYGISIWTDWDGYLCHPATVIQELYGVQSTKTGFLETNFVTGEMKSLFDNDSIYKRALKFYFDANQQGLMDPDSLTQRWGDYWDKTSAGRVLFSNWSWGFGTYATAEKDAAGIGFKPVYFNNEKQVSADGPKYIGETWCYAISSDTQHLDAALKFVDYMYSYDGMWKLALGDQGIYWDLDEAGEPYITEKGWEMKTNALEFEQGGLVGDGLNDINSFGMPWFVKHPVYGKRMDTNDWDKKDFAPVDSKLVVDWQTAMSARDDLDYIAQHGLNVEPPFAPMLPVPEEIEQIVSRVGDVVKTNSWQMIFADSEESFEALWADTVTKAHGMNVAAADEWFKAAYEEGLAKGSKYMQ